MFKTNKHYKFFVLDGHKIAWYSEIPIGTRYYTKRNWAEDPKASPHTKGQGADDRAIVDDFIVIVDD